MRTAQLHSAPLHVARGHSSYKNIIMSCAHLASAGSSSVASIRSMKTLRTAQLHSAPLHVARGHSSYKEKEEECSPCASTSSHSSSFSLQFSLFYAQKKHETGFEPAALALARRCSTTEPLVHFLFQDVILFQRTFKTTY